MTNYEGKVHLHENNRDIRDLHAHFLGMSSVLWATSATAQTTVTKTRISSDIRSGRYIG